MTVSVPVARRVKTPVSDVWIRRVVHAALLGAKAKLLPHGGTVSLRGVKEVGVIFVGDKEMISLNSAHRRKHKTTDVLSFGNPVKPLRGHGTSAGVWAVEVEAGLLGDIVISMPQVKRQATLAGKAIRAELALMLTHGVLHLLGYDHALLKDEKTMFALQTRILKTLRYA